MTKYALFWCTCVINVNSFWKIISIKLQHFYNSLLPSWKTDLITIVKLGMFNIIPKDKLSSHLNLIFMKCFFVYNWFTTTYCFNLIFNFIPNFCVLFKYFFVLVCRSNNQVFVLATFFNNVSIYIIKNKTRRIAIIKYRVKSSSSSSSSSSFYRNNLVTLNRLGSKLLISCHLKSNMDNF